LDMPYGLLVENSYCDSFKLSRSCSVGNCDADSKCGTCETFEMRAGCASCGHTGRGGGGRRWLACTWSALNFPPTSSIAPKPWLPFAMTSPPGATSRREERTASNLQGRGGMKAVVASRDTRAHAATEARQLVWAHWEGVHRERPRTTGPRTRQNGARIFDRDGRPSYATSHVAGAKEARAGEQLHLHYLITHDWLGQEASWPPRACR
jgi:hypothetical protein